MSTVSNIVLGDSRELISTIGDQTIDLIFTDPPYEKKYLHLYGWLAENTPRILKPSGFLAVYVGCYYLVDVINAITPHLEYFMELVLFGSGAGSLLWPRKVIAKHKSILLFRVIGGSGLPRCNITSVFNGTKNDKRFHVWGQEEASARYYIDCLTKENDVVLDPFCGGGTTPAVCKLLKRNSISFDIDPSAIEVSRERVKNQQVLQE